VQVAHLSERPGHTGYVRGYAATVRGVALLVVATLLAVAAVSLLRGSDSDSGGTVPPSGSSAVLWALGDAADGTAASRQLADMIGDQRVDRLLYLGDVYGSSEFGDGTRQAFEEHYDPLYGELARRTAPTPGNHEWPQRDGAYDDYWRTAGGRPAEHFYAFDVAGWEIVSLNSQEELGRGSPQERWLRGELSEPGTCRILFSHRPRFSAGRHGDQPDLQGVWDALRGRAVIAVAGHDHNLQRLRPVDGITQFVSGAGGANRYELHDDERLAFGNETTTGALRLELRPGRADYAFLDAEGHRLDAGSLKCSPLD
jgi:Calcineurin-like phosphoesterase